MRREVLVGLIAAIVVVLGVAFALRSRNAHVNTKDEVAKFRTWTAGFLHPRQSERRFTRAASSESNLMAPGDAASRPTAEELEVIDELARRARAGEYLLNSDNPNTIRAQKEILERRIAGTVPLVTSVRENFLSALNVAPDAIAKLTNHAARITEASLAVDPLMAEISMAKVEYDQKMREVLTPEQYEQFKEFEMRQVLEREWKRDGVGNLDNLSLDDLKGISRSLEELGIREKTSSTYLPYEPEPSSGNRITAEHRDVHENIPYQLLRLEAAAADIEVIGERNQLSDSARQTLASMIATRQKALREKYTLTPTPAEAKARSRARIESHLGRPLPK